MCGLLSFAAAPSVICACTAIAIATTAVTTKSLHVIRRARPTQIYGSHISSRTNCSASKQTNENLARLLQPATSTAQDGARAARGVGRRRARSGSLPGSRARAARAARARACAQIRYASSSRVEPRATTRSTNVRAHARTL